MNLSEINKKRIAEYGKNKFFKDLQELINIVQEADKRMLEDIYSYYDLLFKTDKKMAYDVKKFKKLAIRNVHRLEEIEQFVKLPVITFLKETITHNINYVKEVRKLKGG